MDSRIKRAKMVDQFMTIIFYGIALFFFLLLVGFAGKVIIGGLLGAKPEMFGFTRSGSIGNQVFNTIYLVFISLLVSVPIGVFAGIYLAMYAKPGLVTRFLRTCIETLSSLPSIVVGLFGYLIFLVVIGLSKKFISRSLVYFHSKFTFDHNHHRRCNKRFARRLLSRKYGTWSYKVANDISCTIACMSITYYDWSHFSGWSWLW